MSSAVAIKLSGVGKLYKVYHSRADNLLDASGLAKLLPWHKLQFREFWALRGVDLTVRRGQRLGVIGRNGAGKSTLLKLIMGNLYPTEGEISVSGRVHALIDTGAGFHPEFTGIENIRASLTYLGLTLSEMRRAEIEIAEFTELGEFLNQPFKTYSSGMQARLAFATATAIRPEILIIDEVLGAGDAYFIGKSNERMQQLVDGGATILLVSHSLDQVTKLCEDAIWVDRGRIVQEGRSLEVVKAYQQYIRMLEDRRLQAKNRKVQLRKYSHEQQENFTDTVIVEFSVTGPAGARLAVSEVSLLRGSDLEDRLGVGSAQDAESSHSSFVQLGQTASWSMPLAASEGVWFRELAVHEDAGLANGAVAFNLFHLFEDVSYRLRVRYRGTMVADATVAVWANGVRIAQARLRHMNGAWQEEEAVLAAMRQPSADGPVGKSYSQERLLSEGLSGGHSGGTPALTSTLTVRRWPGDGSLLIDQVRLLDRSGKECAAFPAGASMVLETTFHAERSGEFALIPVAVLYRADGVLISRFVGSESSIGCESGQTACVSLNIPCLNLGNGYYVFTVGLYSKLDVTGLEGASYYDMMDRSYEFHVVGTPALLDGVFRHPGMWSPVRLRNLSAMTDLEVADDY